MDHLFKQYLSGIQPDNTEKTRMGRHKQVECQICFKPIRSDTLKRHMKVHELNITFKTNEEICKDLVTSIVDNALETIETQTVANENENPINKRRGLKRVFDDDSYNSIDVPALRKSIIKDEQQYILKVELGREVYNYIHEAKIIQESLSKERLEALDLYIKQKQKLDRENAKLRPWQQSLLEYIKPTDREVIWVRGINGNEGKTWF